MFTKNHQKFTKTALKVSVIAMATMFGANAYAVDAVEPQTTWAAGNQLNGGAPTLSATGFANKASMTGNAQLAGSAWAHTGRWFTFENTLGGSDVSVSVTGNASRDTTATADNPQVDLTPGLSVWASGSSEFDGGTEAWNNEQSLTNGFGVPHSFNVTGELNAGNSGTDWMADGEGGNMVETLGYAVTNPNIDYASAGWNEVIQSGSHDVSATNNYESGVTGSTSGNSAGLVFEDLAAGWYTVYVGGTDNTVAGATGGFDLVVSAVPEAETWAMLLAGLGLIGWRLRKQKPTEGWNMTAA